MREKAVQKQKLYRICKHTNKKSHEERQPARDGGGKEEGERMEKNTVSKGICESKRL